MGTHFWKWQGLGNDFVVVDRRPHGRAVSAEAARRLCDRHRGIGADGVLSLLASPDGVLAMHVTNADGSTARMCGNGLRCVAGWALCLGEWDGRRAPFDTGRGLLSCEASITPQGLEVAVDMGPPILEPSRIPFAGPPSLEIDAVDPTGVRRRGHVLSMGNPHLVFLVDSVGEARDLAERWGPVLELDPRFPERVNVSFAAQTDGVLRAFVWERGCGLTQACGTGACAVAVTAWREGWLVADREQVVELPGGRLWIRIDGRTGHVWMRAPATPVFSGTWPGSLDEIGDGRTQA